MADLVTDRNIWVTTPLPEGELALERMDGHETLGQPFVYDLSLVSTNAEIDLSKLLGQPMTVHCEMPTGKTRYFNGIATRASHLDGVGRYARYSVTLQPWLSLLDYQADCRIFQQSSIPDIVKDVFRSAGFSDFEDTLDQGAYKQLEYCVQYRESDFHFVSRLMEHEGIYYFFKHEENKHTLVLADSHGAHAPQPGYEQIEYRSPQDNSRVDEERLSSWTVVQQMRSGGYATTDFNFKLPRAGMLSALSMPKKQAHADSEIFDYPGDFLVKHDGDVRAKMRLEERQLDYGVVSASGNVRGLGSGHLFKLANFGREDQNKEYLVVSALYALHAGDYESGADEADDEVRVGFTLIDSQVPYRSPIRAHKNRVEGPQTAIVVGPSGQEIATDEYGRVKVQFHWDRYGMSDERSSCFVRVSQVWAGAKWGAMHIPRIGQEVIVDFLEGDPDRPIITGRVYNADNMPPYTLPDNKTQSGIKSRSTLGGGPNNFNEIRFEDKKGAEQLYIQAEKNQDNLVKADDSLTVGHDRTKAIGNDETVTVGGNRTETVSKDESETIDLNQTVSVGINQSLTVGANQAIAVMANRSITVGANQTETIAVASTETVGAAKQLAVGAAYQISVGAGMTLAVGGPSSETVGGDKSVSGNGNITEGAAGNVTVNAGKDASISAKANGVFHADEQLTLKCGDATIVLKKNGDITIKGNNITVNGSGDVVIKGSKISQN